MDPRTRRLRLALPGFGALALLAAPIAFGDSLLLRDGRLITGEVTRTDSGYVIRTAAGERTFGDDDVEHWTHSDSPDSMKNPAAARPAVTPKSVVSAVPGGAVKDKSSQQKSVAKLVERGDTALAGGDYKAAHDDFADALLLDPRNAAAAQGLGYVYLRLTPPNYAKARDALELAYTALQPPPRSLACDLSLALAQTRNPMRSAKVLKEYLTAHPEPLDEPALNALAAALFQADEQVRRNSFFIQAGRFYDDYNKKLEATRPGEKRWGTVWLAADEADVKLKTFFEKRGRIEDLKSRMANDQSAFRSLSNDAEVERSSGHPGWDIRVAALRTQMNAADADYNAANAELAAVQKGFELPPIDGSLAVVEPETATAIASAAPVGAEPTPNGATDLTSPPPAPAAPEPVVPRPVPVTAHPTPAGAPAVIAARPQETPRRRLRIESNAVAFPVGPDLVVTSADAVSHASYITLQIPSADTLNAQVIASDEASGLALLRVPGKRLAYLPLADSFAPGAITCISFPEVNLFDPIAAAITGTIASAKETPGKFIVNLARSPRLGGGPLLVQGKVVAVQLASRDSDNHTIAVATVDDVKRLLASAGPLANAPTSLDPKSITMQLTAIKESQ